MPQKNALQLQPNPAERPIQPLGNRNWLEQLWFTIADRGRKFAKIPASTIGRGKRAELLTQALLSERGEASGAAVARELLGVLRGS